MRGQSRRLVAAVAAATVLGVGVTACGVDGGASRDRVVSAAEAEALEQAQAVVARNLSNPSLEIEPLSKTPQKNLEVTAVTCNALDCAPDQFHDAAQALHWVSAEETYDLAKGPSDFVAAVRRALQSKPDALAILFVFPPDVIAAEIQRARDLGVVLVDISSALDAPPEGFIACVLCNPALATFGRLQADFVTVDAGGVTTVGVVGDKTIEPNLSIKKAFLEELDRVSPDTEVEDINVSFAQTPQSNAQTVINALQRNPDIEYLMYPAEGLMTGIGQALRTAGLAERVKVVNIGPSSGDQVMLVEQGIPYAWIGGDGPAYWWRVIDVIARSEVGDDFDAAAAQASRVITKDNAQPEMFAPPDYQAAFKRAWGVGD